MQQIHSIRDINKSPILLKINSTQDYAWGSIKLNSYVARISNQNLNHYAQFWMGIHPKGQSKLDNQLSLKQYLQIKSIKQLQFLFKILSIQKCLSIQVHPNQQQAKLLHNQFPQIYVDDKDKPEMFLTLSDEFELFLGFIEDSQMDDLLSSQPFQSLGKKYQGEQYQKKTIGLLRTLVELNEQQLKKNIDILLNNLDSLPKMRSKIIQKIYSQFKYDVGILVSCMLQYHIIDKGSCFGIQAGVPHAYIKGQCLQLMKNSDNVIRLGLTPKKKDTANLLKVVENNFSKGYKEVKYQCNQNIKKFKWNDFQITEIKCTQNQYCRNIFIESNSIGVVLAGDAQIEQFQASQDKLKLQYKNVFFIEPGTYSLKGSAQIYIACKY